MKKISTLLALVLVLALAVPAFAAEDNVKITGEVNTTFEDFNYGDDADEAVTNGFFEDGDAYDDDVWNENAFYQEIDFSVEALVNDDTSLTLDLVTLGNDFTSPINVENTGLQKDVALLTLDTADYTVKLGDLEDYAAEEYFVNEKTLQGMEFDTAVVGNDVKVFALGEGNLSDTNYYGATVATDLDVVTLTGKLYQAKNYALEGQDSDATTFAVAAEADVTDMVKVNGEVASSSAESNTSVDLENDGDTYFKLGTEVTPLEALTVTADMKQVGEKFVLVEEDVDSNYTMYEVAGDYDLTDALSVGSTVTLDTYDDDTTNDVTTIELRASNEMDALTTDVTFTNESEDDDNVEAINTLAVNNTYELSEATELKGNFTYKSQKDVENYTYFLVGANHELAENVTLDTEAFMVSGEDEAAELDGKANGVKATLTTKF